VFRKKKKKAIFSYGKECPSNPPIDMLLLSSPFGVLSGAMQTEGFPSVHKRLVYLAERELFKERLTILCLRGKHSPSLKEKRALIPASKAIKGEALSLRARPCELKKGESVFLGGRGCFKGKNNLLGKKGSLNIYRLGKKARHQRSGKNNALFFQWKGEKRTAKLRRGGRKRSIYSESVFFAGEVLILWEGRACPRLGKLPLPKERRDLTRKGGGKRK